jgi:hypothetical protein
MTGRKEVKNMTQAVAGECRMGKRFVGNKLGKGSWGEFLERQEERIFKRWKWLCLYEPYLDAFVTM